MIVISFWYFCQYFLFRLVAFSPLGDHILTAVTNIVSETVSYAALLQNLLTLNISNFKYSSTVSCKYYAGCVCHWWRNSVWLAKYNYDNDNNYYYTLYSLSAFWLAKSPLLILRIHMILWTSIIIVLKYNLLSNFSINLLVFYHECCSLIGYATHYLFCSSGLGWLHLPRPWLFRISQKTHPIIVYNSPEFYCNYN